MGIMDPWIQRAQAQGGMELIDRGIYVSEPNVGPTAPMSCANQIWV